MSMIRRTKKMAKKQNPMLAAFEARLEANYQQRLGINSEFDLIAFMKTVHEELGVGPGRAFRVFNAFMANKLEIAETIHADYGDKDSGDKEILHTKKKYAKLMKRIFKPEDWQNVKIWFQLLREYWEG
jgi:hypothetical protein